MLPWERARLQQSELEALYDGLRWRRSRDMEVAAVLTFMVLQCWTSDVDIEKVLELLPGYDREHFKAIDAMRTKALRKMKRAAR